MRNHTATHLLHAALRQVLGTHVKQAGSVVEPAALRFDFTHYAALDQAEIEEVERLVNQQILRNIPVDTDVMPLDQAIGTGAMALFGEKYGDQVRVVSIPDFSKELCGGTHVSRTGDIGVCKIVTESSISAGVRRIEAITGERAVERYQQANDALKRIAEMVRVSEPELVEQVEKMLAREKRSRSRSTSSRTRWRNPPPAIWKAGRARSRAFACWPRKSMAWIARSCARWPIRSATSGSRPSSCWRRLKIRTSRSSPLSPKI